MAKNPRRVGRPPKELNRASARETLLEAAHALMIERNTIDVSVTDIADRAQLNPALVNYHFGGKDALLLELAMRNRLRLDAGIKQLLSLNVSADVKLILHIRAMIRAYQRVPYLNRLHHKILRDSDEEAAKTFGTAISQPLALLYREIVRQGQVEGLLKDVNPTFLYVTIAGACDLLFSGRSSLKYGFDVERVDDAMVAAYIDHTIETILRGVLKNPSTDLPGREEISQKLRVAAKSQSSLQLK